MRTLWVEFERFPVWGDDLLHFGRDAAIVKFATLYGDPVTAEQRQIWKRVLAEIERVRAFDRLVVSSPMWNWNVPHALKAWIDIVVQPFASLVAASTTADEAMRAEAIDAARSAAIDARQV